MERPHLAPWSLRSRIYAACTLSVLLAWAAGGVAIYRAAQETQQRMSEENLTYFSRSILELAVRGRVDLGAGSWLPEPPATVPVADVAAPYTRYAYQAWSADGALLLRSPNAPVDRKLFVGGQPGYQHILVNGKIADLFVVRSTDGRAEVQLVDPEDGHLISSHVTEYLAGMLLMTLLPVLALSWLLLRRALAPLQAASDQIRHCGPGALAPLAVPHPPHELQPLIEALNALMGRLGETLSQERAFTALAAHEMRTPLASLRVQAEVVSRCRDDGERQQALRQLTTHVDRCAQLANQLLALARADALSGTALARIPLELEELVATVLEDVADEAAARKVDLHCQLDEPTVPAEPVGMEAVLRNLVCNAMRYTPDGGTIRIESHRADRHVVLNVQDSGPGIAPEERERVMERFTRGRAARPGGVGLGLSIVAAVVRAHGGKIALGASPLGGAKVEISVPR